MRLALLQMDIKLGNVAENQAKAVTMINTALTKGANLIVLPELWTTGYKLADIHNLAEPENGPTITMLQQIARNNKVEIVAGSIAEKKDGKIFNTSYVIGQDGEILSAYRKIHLIRLMNEEKFISPGTQKALFNMSFGPAGLIICYDLRFTELSRALALQGCRTLFVPAEWPEQRGNHWLALNVARAIENQMFVVAVNRVGRDTDNVFFGHSLVIDPWGEILAEGSSDKEEVIVADVDFSAVDEIRSRIPVFADRRPECY